MTPVPISAHRLFRPAFPPIQLPESFNLAADTLGLKVGRPHGFEFRRSKLGTVIWLHFTEGLKVNLSHQCGVYPPTFHEARGWAFDFAQRHGFRPLECRPPTRKTKTLTLRQERMLLFLIKWQRTHRRMFEPTRTDDLDRCDELVRLGFASEHMRVSNFWIFHKGEKRLKPSFLATPSGQEFARLNLTERRP